MYRQNIARRLDPLALCALLASGCGDDTPAFFGEVCTTSADCPDPASQVCTAAGVCAEAAADTGPVDVDDGGIDISPDATEDAPDDVNRDTDATPETGDTEENDSDTSGDLPPRDEICGDGVDNDGDGNVDCDDDDCECGESEDTDSRCSDGIDNDLDGAVDCLDVDCEDSLVCDCTVPIRGGECPSEWDETFHGPFSYVHAIQIPEPDTDAACCFDFDGDGSIDNGLAGLVGPLALVLGDVDLKAQIASTIADGSATLLVEWGKGADEHGFWVCFATNDVDGDGEPDDSFGDRARGDGTFQIDGDSIDEYGATLQFNRASRDGDLVEAGPSIFRFPLPFGAGDDPVELNLTMEQATFQGVVVEGPTGVESADEVFRLDGEDVTFGGWQLGGIVSLDQIGQLFNDLLADCLCADFDATDPIVTYGEGPTHYVMECAQSPRGGCTADDGAICENVGLICSTALPLIPTIGIVDIDSDHSGITDSMSVGLRVSAIGATLAEPPTAP